MLTRVCAVLSGQSCFVAQHKPRILLTVCELLCSDESALALAFLVFLGGRLEVLKAR